MYINNNIPSDELTGTCEKREGVGGTKM